MEALLVKARRSMDIFVGPVPKSHDQHLDSDGSVNVSEGVNLVLEDTIGAEKESIPVNGEAVKSVTSEEDLSSTDSSAHLDVGKLDPSDVDNAENDTGLSVLKNQGESLDHSTRLTPPMLTDSRSARGRSTTISLRCPDIVRQWVQLYQLQIKSICLRAS